jgi:hypothetical protein
VPILIFGLFEQKVSIKDLENDPYTYRYAFKIFSNFKKKIFFKTTFNQKNRTIKKNRILAPLNFIRWNLLASWHSIVSFFFVYGLYSNGASFSSNGTVRKYNDFLPISFPFLNHIKPFQDERKRSIRGASLHLNSSNRSLQTFNRVAAKNSTSLV